MAKVNSKNIQIYTVGNSKGLFYVMFFAILILTFNCLSYAENIVVSTKPLALIISDLKLNTVLSGTVPSDTVPTEVNISVINSNDHDIHTAELLFSDYQKLINSDLIVINGHDLEPWAQKVKANYQSKVYEFYSDNFSPSTSMSSVDNSEAKGDPNLWLDPIATVAAAEEFIDFYCTAKKTTAKKSTTDKFDCSSLEDNFRVWKEKVLEIHAKFIERLKNLKNQSFISSHSAFGAMSARYGLQNFAFDTGCETSDNAPSKVLALRALLGKKSIDKILCEEEGEESQLFTDFDLKCVKSDPFAEDYKSGDNNYSYIDFLNSNLESVLKVLS